VGRGNDEMKRISRLYDQYALKYWVPYEWGKTKHSKIDRLLREKEKE